MYGQARESRSTSRPGDGHAVVDGPVHRSTAQRRRQTVLSHLHRVYLCTHFHGNTRPASRAFLLPVATQCPRFFYRNNLPCRLSAWYMLPVDTLEELQGQALFEGQMHENW